MSANTNPSQKLAAGGIARYGNMECLAATSLGEKLRLLSGNKTSEPISIGTLGYYRNIMLLAYTTGEDGHCENILSGRHDYTNGDEFDNQSLPDRQIITEIRLNIPR
jgi:hypothetical protein